MTKTDNNTAHATRVITKWQSKTCDFQPHKLTRQQSLSANLRQGQNLTRRAVFQGRFSRGEHMGHCCWRPLLQTHFQGGIVFHGRTYHLLVWPRNVFQGHQGRCHWTEHIRLPISILILTLTASLTVSALQSILCLNDLVGRLWPLNDMKVNLDHLQNEITLKLGHDLPLVKNFM